MDLQRKRNLVIGIGNEFRHDDSCGLYVANKLKTGSLPNTDVKTRSGESTGLIETWKGYSTVYVVDAILSPDEPGTIFKINVMEQEIPKNLFKYSIHSFGIAEAVELGKMISELPEKIIIYGIVLESFHDGRGLSSKVLKSSRKVIKSITEELNQLHHEYELN